MAQEQHYDVLIVGGGLAGASLACALRGQALRVGVIEARPLRAPDQPSFDDRTVALAFSSQRIFAALGLWEAIAAQGATPIRRIHVSDRGRLGLTEIDAAELDVAALGYVVEARALGAALAAGLDAGANVDLHCPAELVGLQTEPERIVADVRTAAGAQRLTARVMVAADGADSAAGRLSGARSLRVDYGQTAVIANVAPERPHGGVAYERFTDSGPLALLPAADIAGRHRCALVWTARRDEVDAVLALDDAAFLTALEERFGRRLGRLLEVSPRHAYPLELLHLRDKVRERLVFIGNAAHTLHPVAGQGFNLGLRDVALLAEILTDAVRRGADPGAEAVLRRYAHGRRRDQLQATVFTDALVRVFSNGFAPLAAARDLGLVTLNLLPPARRALARQAMGFIGRMPRLARGLPL